MVHPRLTEDTPIGILSDWQIERDVKIEPFSPAQKRPGVISYGVSGYGYDVRLGYKFRVLKAWPNDVIDPKQFGDHMFDTVDLTPGSHHPQYTERGDRITCERCGKLLVVGKDVIDPPCPKSKPNYIDIPPHGFVLGESIEKFTVPRDVLVVNVGKSTYARCGLVVNVTPGEPEWNGYWTLELSNTTPRYLRVYAGEGIMQSMFFRADGRYELTLALLMDRLGIDPDPTDPRAVPVDMENNSDCLRSLLLREGSAFRQATCNQSYADKKGKYQDQTGLTMPTVDKAEERLKDLCQKERQARVEVVCPKCQTVISIPCDRVDSYNDRHCPNCNCDLPFLPAIGGTTVGRCPATRHYNKGDQPCLLKEGHAGPCKWDSSLTCTVHEDPDKTGQCIHCGKVYGSGDVVGPDNADTTRPPAHADTAHPWASPDGSIWRFNGPKSKWVQVTDPEKRK